jgi:hypothetical protein
MVVGLASAPRDLLNPSTQQAVPRVCVNQLTASGRPGTMYAVSQVRENRRNRPRGADVDMRRPEDHEMLPAGDRVSG